MNKDRIEKKILLRAPLQRVWRALTDSAEFGTWFGVRFHAPFKPGAHMQGVLEGTKVDAEVAKLQQEHKGKPFDITIEKMEPERLFAFRWHPHAIDPAMDYSAEPTTLVEFSLEELADGVMLTVTESGFDQIPLARRAQAFSANEGGWAIMVKVLGEYVGRKP
jgi:uncharacterized protein YndB with AHSA1/START domain